MLSSTHAPNSRARRLQARAQARLTGTARPHPQPLSVRQYRLQCPSGCQVATVSGPAEAARLVSQHPAACPEPGPARSPRVPAPGVTLYPLVYAEPVI